MMKGVFDIDFGETFAGLGVGSLAIKEVFPDAKCKFYSEIEKNRCDLLAKMHPESKNIGDIDYVRPDELPNINLLIGGSPCQDLSIARSNREGLDGHESGLFFQYLEILRVKKPKYFILENVSSMSSDARQEITRNLAKVTGKIIKPVEISSYSFTGQVRKRLYWCNFPIIPVPWSSHVDPRYCIDKSVIPDQPLSAFINDEELHSAYVYGDKVKNPKKWLHSKREWDFIAWSRSTRYKNFEARDYVKWISSTDCFKHKIIWKPGDKVKNEPGVLHDNYRISYVEQRIKVNMQANTLLTGPGCSIFSSRNLVRYKDCVRHITPLEAMRLQGIPDDHIQGWTTRNIEKAVGDAFTLPVIVHLIKSLKDHMENTNK